MSKTYWSEQYGRNDGICNTEILGIHSKDELGKRERERERERDWQPPGEFGYNLVNMQYIHYIMSVLMTPRIYIFLWNK